MALAVVNTLTLFAWELGLVSEKAMKKVLWLLRKVFIDDDQGRLNLYSKVTVLTHLGLNFRGQVRDTFPPFPRQLRDTPPRPLNALPALAMRTTHPKLSERCRREPERAGTWERAGARGRERRAAPAGSLSARTPTLPRPTPPPTGGRGRPRLHLRGAAALLCSRAAAASGTAAPFPAPYALRPTPCALRPAKTH